MKRAKSLWTNHATKILGYLVAVLGALSAFDTDFKALFWSDRGDQIFSLVVKVANYLLIGAGAIIIRRGYTNTRRAGETPFTPGESTTTQGP